MKYSIRGKKSSGDNVLATPVLTGCKYYGRMCRKIYCCDRGDSDNALAAAILANKSNDNNLLPFAMMNGAGGMNGWMNNPFAYIMFLALFRNGGFGFGGDGALFVPLSRRENC